MRPGNAELITDKLYAILDVSMCRERGLEPLAVLDAFLAGGARFIQLRDKSPSSRDRLALADAAVTRVRAAGGRLVVNDRPDIARLSVADGVHVGQDDLPVAAARAILGPAAIIGLSTHDAGQVDAALQTTATYVAVGPIYETATKDTGYTPRGIALIQHAARGTKPVVAIGGITLERARAVIAAGAASVAVISDLLRDDPETMVRRFRQTLDEAGSAP